MLFMALCQVFYGLLVCFFWLLLKQIEILEVINSLIPSKISLGKLNYYDHAFLNLEMGLKRHEGWICQ